jgi:hypothetical protein
MHLAITLTECIARLVSMNLERVDLGKMNLQLVANEKNQDRVLSKGFEISISELLRGV